MLIWNRIDIGGLLKIVPSINAHNGSKFPGAGLPRATIATLIKVRFYGMSALPPILLQKSFCVTELQIFRAVRAAIE
jgi:hypothetical protein